MACFVYAQIINYLQAKGSVCKENGKVIMPALEVLEQLALVGDNIIAGANDPEQFMIKNYAQSCMDIIYNARHGKIALMKMPAASEARN